ncbi:hypothetical protein CTI12_AA396580 [Artemisia annua]|uniref:Uncharacterized protein n=1 Tax=Artemisia annua TaxID=35608 RepID=A0A2U1MC53_ARTAN|nr:hypothetical protein CTI12_AA396580 [Artemisia annua]
MADKGKAVFIGDDQNGQFSLRNHRDDVWDDHSSVKDWSKVVLTDEIIDEVAKYGEEVETKYGGYENISEELQEEILEFVRKKSCDEMAEDKLNVCSMPMGHFCSVDDG